MTEESTTGTPENSKPAGAERAFETECGGQKTRTRSGLSENPPSLPDS